MKWSDSEIESLLKQRLTVKELTTIMETRGTVVIPPNAITTRELRLDQSRFFVTLDNNQVVNGYFG